MYSDEDFDKLSDDEIEDDLPIGVSVTNSAGALLRRRQDIDSNYADELEQDSTDVGDLDSIPIERGGRLKMSMKPPEMLLREYKKHAEESIEKKKYELAIEDLIRCTALARIVHGDTSWKYADSEATLANAYWIYKGMAAQAQQHAAEARNIMLRVVQTGGAQDDKADIYRVLLSAYITLGEANNSMKKYADAELSFQKAEKILSERQKLRSVNLNDSDDLKPNLRVAQGKLAANQKKAASAIAYFEEAISLIQERYGEDSVKLILLYQMVGKVEQSREGANHEKSIDAYLQAHSIANANYSDGTIELAETGFQLALAYALTGDPDGETSAESYLNECIATYQTVYGPNHEKTLMCQDELARLMIRTDRPDEALQVLRSSITARKTTYGEYSDNLASTYKLIGSVHLSQGNMDKSLRAMSKELTNAESEFRRLHQQHLEMLEMSVTSKEKQLAEGKVMFDQLKKDFKYNLRLLQERDAELAENDTALAELRSQLSLQMASISELSVRLKEKEEQLQKQEETMNVMEKNYHQRFVRERTEADQLRKKREAEMSAERLDWESERRSLQEQLKLSEEARLSEKRELELHYEQQHAQRELEWRKKADDAAAETLVYQLRLNSLTIESDKLRQNNVVQGQLAENAEEAQRKVENEFKQCQWELQDYRAVCTRQIQDLEQARQAGTELQKKLIDKYERKLAQAEARHAENNERNEKLLQAGNDKVSHINAQLLASKEKLTEAETELTRLKWKVDDLNNEKDKIVNDSAAERVKLIGKVNSLEANNESHTLREELTRVKEILSQTREDLLSKRADVERYQTELVAAQDNLSEAERKKAQAVLDCQKRMAESEREQYRKTETLVTNLTKARDEALATVKKLEKEAGIRHKAAEALRRDRNEAYDTLRANGLNVQVKSYMSNNGETNNEKPTAGLEYVNLKNQNESLKSVIAQMRREMESVRSRNPNSSVGEELYIKNLEEEIKQLKAATRLHVKTTPEPNSDDIIKAIEKGDNSAIRDVVQSLTASISQLRSEKVQLIASTRKQQVLIQRLQDEKTVLTQNPKQMQTDLDQARYELNAQERRYQTEIASLKQRTVDLESLCEGAREEAAEYHRSLLTANADRQSLSTELATMKMDRAKSGEVINYGAQELVIQNLQDENERLRGMIRGEIEGGGEELSKALKRVTQLQREKAVLTEVSNRLRAELSKAGIALPKQPPCGGGSSDAPVGKPLHTEDHTGSHLSGKIRGKLAQLEKLQYDITKADMRRDVDSKQNQTSRPSFPKPHIKVQSRDPTYPLKAVTLQHNRQMESMPSAIEGSSSSGSIMQATGKPTKFQSRIRTTSKYVAPKPAGRLKSNVAWLTKRNSPERLNSNNNASPRATMNVSSTALYGDSDRDNTEFVSPGNQLIPERDVSGTSSSSLGMGSSIQDVWKLLDEGPHYSFTTPRSP